MTNEPLLLSCLPPRVSDILIKGGINKPEQIILQSDSDLLKLGNLSTNDVALMKDTSASFLTKNITIARAFDLKQASDNCCKISLGCEILNKALKGGLRCGTITEISAESGCGKTQICLQIAMNAWKSGAVYICTEEAFASTRLHQMFTCLHQSLPKSERLSDLSKYGDNIFVQRVLEVVDLKKCINTNLRKLLEAKKNISVVIIDSIAAPFRGNYQQVNSGITRAQDLKEIATSLLDNAIKYKMAVLCINQVSSSMAPNITSECIPSLGLAWANLVSCRLTIKKINSIRPENIETKNTFLLKALESASYKNINLENEEISNSKIQLRQLEVAFAPDLPSGPVAQFAITAFGVMGINQT